MDKIELSVETVKESGFALPYVSERSHNLKRLIEDAANHQAFASNTMTGSFLNISESALHAIKKIVSTINFARG